MTFDEFQTLVNTAIPTADIDFTHDGQIVIYTNLAESNGEIIPFEED